MLQNKQDIEHEHHIKFLQPDKIWTKDEINKLKRLYMKDVSTEDIAKMMGRTESSIKQQIIFTNFKMKNRLYYLPEELQIMIFKKTYDEILKEIKDFISVGNFYVYRKPNKLNRSKVILVAFRFHEGHEDWEFQNIIEYYNGNRQTHFLSFGNAFFYLKKHPTGVYENGDKIEYVY